MVATDESIFLGENAMIDVVDMRRKFVAEKSRSVGSFGI